MEAWRPLQILAGGVYRDGFYHYNHTHIYIVLDKKRIIIIKSISPVSIFACAPILNNSALF